jgi:hypothetical protein
MHAVAMQILYSVRCNRRCHTDRSTRQYSAQFTGPVAAGLFFDRLINRLVRCKLNPVAVAPQKRAFRIAKPGSDHSILPQLFFSLHERKFFRPMRDSDGAADLQMGGEPGRPGEVKWGHRRTRTGQSGTGTTSEKATCYRPTDANPRDSSIARCWRMSVCTMQLMQSCYARNNVTDISDAALACCLALCNYALLRTS